ncbi:MAG: serine/threonine protein kinase, partial [Pirellulales bacterium]|nr:serine/threonine protein kinase [Pirellulales bacterium]
DVLGSGGMGCVYSAREVGSDWPVAIKVLSNERRNDAGMVVRLQLEAEAGLRLKHPNILRTLALNQSEDRYGVFSYMVMELVQGVTPLEWFSVAGKISWEQVCDVIQQAAEALEYAHGVDLIHRDVKPENLLLRTNGTVKVLDFGLAMLDENDEEFSMAMIFGQDRVGTADYVAPEQTINSYEVDHRVDIYSLGCTFYFMLTGKLPFPYSRNGQKIMGHRKKKPLPIAQFSPEVPEAVVKVVERMMAKQPERRYSTALEVANAVKPFARREPIPFDFEKIRNARVQLAGRRAAKKKRSATSSPRSSSLVGDSTARQQAKVETKAPTETDDTATDGTADDVRTGDHGSPQS